MNKNQDFTTLKEQKQFMKQQYNGYKKLIENTEFGRIKPRQKYIVSTMLHEQKKENDKYEGRLLKESSQAGDITGVTPMLIPVLRRMVPAMLAFDICGVQPMTAPTGLVFAIRPVFQNDSNDPVKKSESAIITLVKETGDGDYTDFITDVDITGVDSGATGTILFKPSTDSTIALIKVTSGTFVKGEEVSGGGNTMHLSAVDDNVAMYKNLLTGYAGPLTSTASAEYLGKDIKEMGFTIESETVTAKPVALKAKYTLELEQDLKNLHSLNASEELQTFLSQEIATEINADLVSQIKVAAKAGGEYIYNYDMNLSDGRWMMEKFRGLVHMIEVAANDLYISTRRGKGNILICSPNVCSVLSQLTGFYSYNPSMDTLGNSKINSNYSPSNGFAGTFNNMKVFVDPWATEEFLVVAYKGESEFDAGIFYCPYTPVVTMTIPDPETGQNVIHFKTRYGTVDNPFGSFNYFRYISVVDLPLNIPKAS